jgi:hypothetical protein
MAMSKYEQRILAVYFTTVCALFAMVQGCVDETGMATRYVERPQQVHLWVGTEFGQDKTEPVGTDQKVFYPGDNIAIGLLVSRESRHEAYQVSLVNAETGKLIKELRREIAPEAEAGGQYHKYKIKVLPVAEPQRVIVRAKVGLLTKETFVTLMPKATSEQVRIVRLPKEPTVEPKKPPVRLPKEPTVVTKKPPVRLTKKPAVEPEKPPVRLTKKPTVEPKKHPVRLTKKPAEEPEKPPVRLTKKPTVESKKHPVILPKKPIVEPRKPPVRLPKKPTVEPKKPPVRLPKKPTVVAKKPPVPTISEQYIFSCNYWKDSNKDGIADYPNEFAGIKNRFRKGDRIILVCWLKGTAIKGKRLITKIYSPKGKEITKDMFTIISRDDFANMVGEPDADLMDVLFRKGGLGTYKVAWYLDRKLIGMHEFEITE